MAGPWASGVDATAVEPTAASAPATVESQRVAIGVAVNAWMVAGGIGLHLGWRGENSSRLEVAAPGLLGGLGMQMALVTTGLDTWATCSACGVPSVPTRRPRTDQRRFCDACREKRVDKQYAKRNAAARNRAHKENSR